MIQGIEDIFCSAREVKSFLLVCFPGRKRSSGWLAKSTGFLLYYKSGHKLALSRNLVHRPAKQKRFEENEMKAYIKGIASYLPVHVEYNDAE